MSRLRWLTAGESHGPALTTILEGLPAGLWLTTEDVDRELARRQHGHGRGGRMKIERDQIELLAGVRFGKTLGSPISMLVRNRDFASWTDRMQAAPGGPDARPVHVPRPGHADLAGGLKYGHTDDLRNVLERASARETAARVAAGAIAKALLRELGIRIGSWVRQIGTAQATGASEVHAELFHRDAEALARLADASPVRALDDISSAKLVEAIDSARAKRDTVGGVIEVAATGMPVGLGAHVQHDRKLDGRIAQAMLSIPAMKAVELGDGWSAAGKYGSEVHDAIHLRNGRLVRESNRAGGLEGGITNGEPLVVRVAMKPIATVPEALPSVNLSSIEATHAHVERSDTCAVPAAGVVAEAMLALVLADAVLEALGGDTMDALRAPFAKARLATRADLGHRFLIGPMGAGKTSVGLILARQLGLPFIDLDARIEAEAGTSIAALFARDGETAFRELESKALAKIAKEPASVVALGGGAALTEGAWLTLRESGATLHLHAPAHELLRRIGDPSKRPLLVGGEPLARLNTLAAERERWYARADLHLDTTGLSAELAAGAAVGLFRSIEGPLVKRHG